MPIFYLPGFVVIGLLVYVVFHVMCKLIHGGITFVREEEHSLGLRSPWWLFGHYVKSRRGYVYTALACYALSPALIYFMSGIRWNWSFMESAYGVGTLLFAQAYFVAGSLMAMLLLAPRISRNWIVLLLAFFGGFATLVGALYFWSWAIEVTPVERFSNLYLRVRDTDMGGYRDVHLFMIFAPLVGVIVGPLVGLWTRFVTGESWFRLNKM